jgi:hypothetical protein
MRVAQSTANRVAPNSAKEFGKGNFQCLGNLFDIDQRYVPFATFDLAECGSDRCLHESIE